MRIDPKLVEENDNTTQDRSSMMAKCKTFTEANSFHFQNKGDNNKRLLKVLMCESDERR